MGVMLGKALDLSEPHCLICNGGQGRLAGEAAVGTKGRV